MTFVIITNWREWWINKIWLTGGSPKTQVHIGPSNNSHIDLVNYFSTFHINVLSFQWASCNTAVSYPRNWPHLNVSKFFGAGWTVTMLILIAKIDPVFLPIQASKRPPVIFHFWGLWGWACVQKRHGIMVSVSLLLVLGFPFPSIIDTLNTEPSLIKMQ